jgi:hypothetical protein
VNDGRPLAVCINDCEIDNGQTRSELEPICFQVGCAFAEMRWGNRTDIEPIYLWELKRKSVQSEK